MSKAALEAVKKKFASEVISEHAQHGDETLVLKAAQIRSICEFCRDDPALAMDMLTDLTAVDYLMQGREVRFEVVYHLYSTTQRHRLRLKLPVSEDKPEVASVTGVWKSANWMEREVWDLYGIRFDGHPDLRRILLYEEFVGHPLRKDYPIAKRQPLTRREDPVEGIWEQKHILTGPSAGAHFRGSYDVK
jgi:NADH-quinone oxidoreductase subunit C